MRIRIRRIHMFLGLPDPDPLVRDPDPDPSTIKQKNKKNFDSYCFTSFYDFLSLKMTYVPEKLIAKKICCIDVLKVTDENSRIRILIRIQIHYSELWIPESKSVQNFMDPQHCLGLCGSRCKSQKAKAKHQITILPCR